MVKYILKRLGISVLILLGVSLILYTLLRCMPTDFVEQKILALTTGGAEVQEEMKKKLYEADFAGLLEVAHEHCALGFWYKLYQWA